MRRLCGLVFFLLLVTPSFCQATNWQQISHQPQYLLDRDSLTYQKNKDGKPQTALIGVVIRRSINQDQANKMAAGQTDSNLKSIIESTAYEENLYWFNLEKQTFYLAGSALLSSTETILATSQTETEPQPIPDKGLVAEVFKEILSAQVKKQIN